MSEPFLGEIKMFGFNWPPRDWAQCDGALLPINENQSLYSLLGTTFGGDGKTSFALPDLRGRVPIHKGILGGTDYVQGLKAGQEAITLVSTQMPAHTHTLNATNDPGNAHAGTDTRIFAASNTSETYSPADNLTHLKNDTCSNTGGSYSHNNIQPIQVINFCIALRGLFPSRN